jgi:glycosyltransferase involved in cell wall biosynthesis
MSKKIQRQAESADIALLLEGSYPYVVGGVSQWMQKVIENLPQYKFAIIFFGSIPEDYPKGMQYELPENVVHYEEHFLFSERKTFEEYRRKMAGKSDRDVVAFDLLQDFFRKQDEKLIREYRGLSFYIKTKHGTKYTDFFHSKRSWEFIVDSYEEYCTDPSFIDYFWNVMHMQKPLWKLANLVEGFIKVKAVHTVSTGYAGFYGALLNMRYNYPLILTEHGIYSEERRIELLQKEFAVELDPAQRFAAEMSYIRNLWLRYFDLLAIICYHSANPITSLYITAKTKQLENGASEERLKIIPNGINVKKFSVLREKRPAKPPPILCIIGRIVPIKDMKTFIRAINIMRQSMPEVEGWIAGPADENPEYLKECEDLVSVLDLRDNIKFFPGRQDIAKFFPKIGLNVLTSISEGMPLILLEGFAAGVPALTTDVGACREIIFGGSDEDKKLGAAGDVVPIANPQKFAEAALSLLQDEKKWKKAQSVAIERVEKYYEEKLMFDQYQGIYQKAMQGEEK